MDPSGGGGEYAALILSSCATSVGSFGIQLPTTIRPPGRVTRTISLATSNGLGANIAPKMLGTRSNESSANSFRSEASSCWKVQFVRPSARQRDVEQADRQRPCDLAQDRDTHLEQIYTKLGDTNRALASLFAAKYGLIAVGDGSAA